MNSEFYINSKKAKGDDLLLILQSSAFLWGMSAFTTGFVQERSFYFGQSHLSRLREGVKYLFGEELSVERLKENLRISLNDSVLLNDKSPLKLRITYFKNSKLSELCFLIELSPLDQVNEIKSIQSVFRMRPQDAFIKNYKIGSYSDSFRLKNEMDCEPFFFNGDEYYEDSSISNILLRRKVDKQWVSPIGNFFKGISLVSFLKSRSLEEEKIKRGDENKYDCAVMINSLRGVQFLKNWNGRELLRDEESINELQKVFFNQAQEDIIKL